MHAASALLALAGAAWSSPTSIALSRARPLPRARPALVTTGRDVDTTDQEEALINFAAIADEYNADHAEDVARIARRHSGDVDFREQELAGARIASITERGLELEEVLCAVCGETCVALTVAVAFEAPCGTEEALRRTLAELAAEEPDPAGAGGPTDETEEPSAKDRKSAESSARPTCTTLLADLNGPYLPYLEAFAKRALFAPLAPGETLEWVRAVELDPEGFTVEVVVCRGGHHELLEACCREGEGAGAEGPEAEGEATEVQGEVQEVKAESRAEGDGEDEAAAEAAAAAEADEGGETCEVRDRRVAFPRACASVEEVEDALCQALLA